MLAVWCFMVFAAVGERLAVSGGKSQDGGMWDWFTPDGWPDSGGASMATEITYPKRLVQQIKSEEEMAHERLDTRVRNGSGDSSPVHLAQSSFQVEAFGHTFTLDLELNHGAEWSGAEHGTQGGEHCYYQGRLRGLPESWAAVSTCHGLCGMFSDGFFSYGIEPVHNGTNQ
ncbi:hypothetical protein INR49_017871, partial [Caranx melampygus]